jgi:hypothetical protein
MWRFLSSDKDLPSREASPSRTEPFPMMHYYLLPKPGTKLAAAQNRRMATESAVITPEL